MSKLLHEELTYTIRGVLFDIEKQLGPMLPERFYQDAVEIGLTTKRIPCQTEKQFDVTYRGVPVGRYYVDSWIADGKVLLEIKVAPEIQPLHRAQAISYLKVTNANLAMIANFGQTPMVTERLPNFLDSKKPSFRWKDSSSIQDTLFPELTNILLRVLYQVHFALGPGFLHQVYRRATMVELREQEIGFEYIKELPVTYQKHYLGNQAARIIQVDGRILVATIAVQEVTEAMKTLLRVRLRQLNTPLGLLANFHNSELQIYFVRLA